MLSGLQLSSIGRQHCTVGRSGTHTCPEACTMHGQLDHQLSDHRSRAADTCTNASLCSCIAPTRSSIRRRGPCKQHLYSGACLGREWKKHHRGRDRPDGVESVPLHLLSDGVANHEAQEARDGFCFHRICLNLPAVRLPQVPNLRRIALLSEKDSGAICNGRTAGPAERSACLLCCTTSIMTARRD